MNLRFREPLLRSHTPEAHSFGVILFHAKAVIGEITQIIKRRDNSAVARPAPHGGSLTIIARDILSAIELYAQIVLSIRITQSRFDCRLLKTTLARSRILGIG
jgi:hypothetical protein